MGDNAGLVGRDGGGARRRRIGEQDSRIGHRDLLNCTILVKGLISIFIEDVLDVGGTVRGVVGSRWGWCAVERIQVGEFGKFSSYATTRGSVDVVDGHPGRKIPGNTAVEYFPH